METAPAAPARFNTPEEELAYLRREVAKKELALRSLGQERPQEEVIAGTVRTYASQVREEPPEPPTQTSQEAAAEGITLDLAPEAHDRNMEELLGVLQSKGIKHALSVVEATKNPHLEDDFHRFLVQYVKSGMAGLKEKKGDSLWRALRMTLYEVTLPETSGDEEAKKKGLGELIASMEQFYQGMQSVSGKEDGGKAHFTIELAVPAGSNDLSFFVSVPDHRRDLFEKQLLAVFPKAVFSERKDDYNIYADGGAVVGAVAEFKHRGMFSLKTYDLFEYDPLNVLLNAFAKLDKEDEGAAFQVVIHPAGNRILKRYQQALKRIYQGVSLSRATDIRFSLGGEFWVGLKELFSSAKRRAPDEPRGPRQEDKQRIENLERKVKSPIVAVNIRLLASAKDPLRAEGMFSELAAAFNQFEDTFGNTLTFKRVGGSALKALERAFSFRTFTSGTWLPFSLSELASVAHFPPLGIASSPELKQSKAATAPAPAQLPGQGVLLGINRHRGRTSEVRFAAEDRLRHLYVIGQTGTGKSTFLKNLVIQDIQNGEGVCMIDPHGVDVLDVLASVPPERHKDVVYFDPANVERPMGLNMLEYDPAHPEQKTFVVNELLSIFNKLFDMKVAGGPAFEQYFRNSALLVMEDPASGNTLFDIGRVLADKSFRDLKLSKNKNPTIRQFWENAERTTGEQSLANFVPYITNKFDVFTTNDIMRPIIAQERSAFRFREIMDGKKILLVNLAKGRLGDINANLIGLVLVGKILMAALSRVDGAGKEFPPFYLYIDEFQNVTTDSIATILSEARKYKLALTVAHQFIKQLSDPIRDAVFGNVGSMAVFRVGAEDAEALKPNFEPTFAPSDLMNLDNRNAYLKLLVGGKPEKPFNMETLPPLPGDKASIDKIKEMSYLAYGRPRAEIEAEIARRYSLPGA